MTDLVAKARAALKKAERLGIPSPLMSDMADRIEALEAENARLREALTLIERIYYMEGKDASWRASKMNAVAYDAQNGSDLAKHKRLFPRNAEARHD